jgi:hypothetical protein
MFEVKANKVVAWALVFVAAAKGAVLSTLRDCPTLKSLAPLVRWPS